MTTPTQPRLLKALARLGILFGTLSSMYAAVNAGAYLQGRDEFVNQYQQAVEVRMPVPSASPSPSPSPAFSKLPEQVAEKLYSRRGVILPLAAVNFILSMLLLFGCLRALRGSAWGLSAWTLACVASIPYQVLNAASSVLEVRDVVPLFGEPTAPNVMLALIWMVVCILFYGGCLVYLRRPQIRALFR